jgi:ABC-type phosphate transport system substrate-binding protein
MSMRTSFTVLAAGAALMVAGQAQAQTTACSSLTSPIYITGSTALEPLIKTIGPLMANAATNPHTIVYLKDGSCSGVARIGSDGLIKQNPFYIPANYVAGATVPTCTVDTTNGQAETMVLSDVDPTLCPGAPALTGVKDFQGPVNNMVMVVPTTSTQQAISAEEAYLVFGMGAGGQVMPWIDPTYYFIRTPDSGTRAMIAANIGTGTHAWQGVSKDPTTMVNFGSGDVLKNVAAQATANPEKTIGILGEDFYDQSNNRSQVKALAFRAFHQCTAYWPDSTFTSRDKKNVREGRYAIWGYVHMLAKVDGSGVPTDPNAKFFIDTLQNNLTPAPAFDVNDVITDSHLTPICAMKVTHDIEAAPMKPFSPTAPCGCSFEKRATGAEPPGCMACTSTCPGSMVCRKGYCEAQ